MPSSSPKALPAPHSVANPCGNYVSFARYPIGASKWNPIEHRLISEVHMNRAGIPLESPVIIINSPDSTTSGPA